MKLSDLATRLQAKLVVPPETKNGDPIIQRVAPITSADEGDITFISNPEYAKYSKTTNASAIIMKDPDPECKVAQLIHANPYLTFAKAANLFYRPSRGPAGVSEKAFIASDAHLGEGVTVSPFAYVESGAKIGENVVLSPGVYVGENAEIGAGTIVYANTVIYHECKIGKNCILHAGCVIGADGFGYAVGDGEIYKIPQVGNVIIEDNVELGAGCTVDRAAMGTTLIKSGSKLDNRVQVGHNCVIGKNCLLSASVGLAGSSKLGDWVVMGGHSAVNGHIEVASQTRVGGMSGVVKSVEKPEELIGFPAISANKWRRQQVYLKRLAEYEKRLKDLEKRLDKKALSAQSN